MKKTIIALAVASVALASAAFAGGYAPAPQKASMTGPYLEGMFGAANRHLLAGFNHFEKAPGLKNQNWGWALGADLGYQFDNIMSAELGGFWTSAISVGDQKANNWIGYAAGRMTYAINHIDLFGKFGLALNHQSISNGGSSATGFAPLFALGAAYNINQNLYITGQYTYVAQSWNSYGSDQGTSLAKTGRVQLLTLGLGYRFGM